jgi:crotonobetainyl-CoA:carnitine CoA-transferase CaiB-like acyl-CoA transferase
MEHEQRNKQEKPGPLDGIKVVEYGVFHAGPGGTAILGDLGAEIIKIEAPAGDPIRFWTEVGPISMAKQDGESIMNEVSNRNKRNICLDIKQTAGREIFERLVKTADVFMTNLRKSTKNKLKLDYPSIKTLNPNIIHASVTGYGPNGPMEDIGAFDPLGQACSGMMFVTGQPFPAPLQIGILDQATAISLSHAVITALLARERQGHGQQVQVSLYGTSLWLQHPNLMMANALAIDPCVKADRETHSPLRNAFCCKDGRWLMGTHHPEERYWKSFCELTGQTGLFNDPQFTDEIGRPRNYPELVRIFDRVFAERTSWEWMTDFQSRKLMFCPIQRIQDVQHDVQAQVNGYIQPYDYKGLGKVNIPGYPIHFSENDAGFKSEAPEIGQHTDQVLAELGYSESRIDTLREEHIVR